MKLFEFRWSEYQDLINTTREQGDTMEEAWASIIGTLVDPNSGKAKILSWREITAEMLEEELIARRKAEQKVIDRYVTDMAAVAEVDHPAVIAHLAFTRAISGGRKFAELDHDDQFFEADSTPNHVQMVHYLTQLPRTEYAIYAPDVIRETEADGQFVAEFDREVGLRVWLEDPGSDQYGRIWLIEDRDGRWALTVEINGCAGVTGGPRYTVYPKK